MCNVSPKIFYITLENHLIKSDEILRIVRYDIKNQLFDFLQVHYQESGKIHLSTELDTIQLIE